jgi:hypothetical protein
MVLYASYACLLYSRFVENHLIDLAAMNPSFLRWFCHTHTLPMSRQLGSSAPLAKVLGGVASGDTGGAPRVDGGARKATSELDDG